MEWLEDKSKQTGMRKVKEKRKENQQTANKKD